MQWTKGTGARMRTASMLLLATLAQVFGSLSLESTEPARMPTLREHSRPEPKVVNIDRLPQRSIVNIGQLAAGKRLSVQVHLRNQLDRTLSIQSITSDCGCVEIKQATEGEQDDDLLKLEVELAGTQKVGRIRRNLRVFFAEEPTSPLDLGLDTIVVGPLALETSQVKIENSTEPLVLTGQINSANVDILDCQPSRGVCRVLDLHQAGKRFQVRIQPLVPFGSANEVLRLRYRICELGEAMTIELPLELRCISPIHFFPSVASIQYQQGGWQASAKIVRAPGSELDFESLKLSLVRADGSQISDSDYRIELLKASVVLYLLRVHCSTPPQPCHRPVQLRVAAPQGERLATLRFSSP